MLYTTLGALERCAKDKAKIRIICPDIWLHYVVDGQGYYNGSRLSAGRGFIVYRNDPCEYFPDRNDPWTYVWMRLSGEDEEGLLRRCSLPSASGVFSFDYAEELTALAPRLFSSLASPRGNRVYKEAVAKAVLSLHAKDSASAPPARDEHWVLLAKEYIAQYYHKPLTVGEIADALHIDRMYLRNLFVKHTGMPTKRYLDRYRMERAAELLRIPDVAVGLVALSVGYRDPLAFSKAFRSHFGLSPLTYRKQENHFGLRF